MLNTVHRMFSKNAQQQKVFNKYAQKHEMLNSKMLNSQFYAQQENDN